MRLISPSTASRSLGAARRKVLRSKHELAQPTERMDYEPRALEYSGITMERLEAQGVDLKKVAGAVLRFAERATLSKGTQCKPVLIGQNITFDIGFLTQADELCRPYEGVRENVCRKNGLLWQLPASLSGYDPAGTAGIGRRYRSYVLQAGAWWPSGSVSSSTTPMMPEPTSRRRLRSSGVCAARMRNSEGRRDRNRPQGEDQKSLSDMTKEQNDNVVLGRNERGEETITFRVEDLTTYGVLGADGTEFMAAISGYGLDIAFNLKLINSLADAEAMADAMADVFYEALMAQLIDRKRIQVKPAGAQDPILG